MPKKRRVYISRVVGNQVMTSADLERLHKYMLEIEHISVISDEVRTVVEEEWPELAHKLPPKPSINLMLAARPLSAGYCCKSILTIPARNIDSKSSAIRKH
jgi:hypothetical protein